MNQQHPEIIQIVADPKYGTLGYVVVDTLVNDVSWGGVRMMEEVSLEELKLNARTMTRKYAFIGEKTGGAKAGVCVPEDGEIRRKKLLLFGEKIAPLLQSNVYNMGIDMGARMDDLLAIAEGAGIPLKHFKRWKDISYLYTSWSVLVAIDEAFQSQGREYSETTVALEGFGKVGSETALQLFRKGAKIVAVSNSKKAIYYKNGLNIEQLYQLRKEHGDKGLLQYQKAESIEHQDLFSLPVDLLIPCARTGSIHTGNADSIQASIICPGANAPMSDEVEESFFQKGVLCFPDFLANVGGVLGSKMKDFVSYQKIQEFIFYEYRKKIQHVFQTAQKENRSIGTVAREVVQRNIHRMKKQDRNPSLKQKMIKSIRPLVPRGVKKLIAYDYFLKELKGSF